MTQGLTDPSAPFFRFEVDYDEPPRPISIAGRGYVGGKAIGLLYSAGHLNDPALRGDMRHGDMVHIPDTTVLTSEYFDRFLEFNDLGGAYAKFDYQELVARYLRGRFPDSDRTFFRELISRMDHPLAIRSSSLLEDNIKYSFAGIYLTLFIPNSGDLDQRLDHFEAAVKRVFASTYNPNAHAYRDHHNLRGRDEKMSVIVQRMIGKTYGEHYYPPMAGVAFSRNYFPWSSRIKVEDGLVRLVFGLGTRAVGRNYARVFSPTQPMLRPEGSVVNEIVRYSQDYFDAINLRTGELVSPAVADAVEVNPEVLKVSSVLVGHELLKESSPLGLGEHERPVVTFRSILKDGRYIPLVSLITELLKSLQKWFGLSVDVEFACNFGADPGVAKPEFYLLQCRPLGVRAAHRRVRIPTLDDRTVVFSGGRCMGNGRRKNIKHLLYVSPSIWKRAPAPALARTVGRIGKSLRGEPFILAGPGRWGTDNPELGIPVTYGEIAGASVLVEIASGPTTPELSYGTHFFGDLFADNTFYLPVFPEMGDRHNTEWLEAQPDSGDGEFVKLITREEGFTVTFDGRIREAAIYL